MNSVHLRPKLYLVTLVAKVSNDIFIVRVSDDNGITMSHSLIRNVPVFVAVELLAGSIYFPCLSLYQEDASTLSFCFT